MCRVAQLHSPEGRLFCPRLGPAHITHQRLGTQEGVRALGDLRAPIKPSQSSNKELVIFDDLKGLVLEWECEGEGGGEILKKTKRTVIRCPRRWKSGGGVCALSVILRALSPSSSTSTLTQQWDVGKTGAQMGLLRERGLQGPPTTLLRLGAKHRSETWVIPPGAHHPMGGRQVHWGWTEPYVKRSHWGHDMKLGDRIHACGLVGLSEPQLPHLPARDSNRICFLGLLGGINRAHEHEAGLEQGSLSRQVLLSPLPLPLCGCGS